MTTLKVINKVFTFDEKNKVKYWKKNIIEKIFCVILKFLAQKSIKFLYLLRFSL